MAYSRLTSPLPNLTVSLNGCCGSRHLGSARRRFAGLGQDDESDTGDISDLMSPGDVTPIIVPTNTISPVTPVDTGAVDLSDLPLDSSTGTDISSLYPSTVGTEFVSNGDGTYTNIQTGQSVPYSTAAAVTSATTGSATASVATQGTEQGVNLVDPTTGQSYSGTLTASAQALQSTGQLVTAAGQLTAAGQALAKQGMLISQPSATASVSAALSSLSSWFGQQTLMAGVPNGILAGGFVIALMILPSMLSSKPKRRR